MTTLLNKAMTLAAIIFLALILLTACSPDDPSPADQLTGEWTVSRVTLDGVDITHEFEGFTLQFAANTYTAANGEPVWPATGTWSLINPSVFVRHDGIEVNIDNLTPGALTLSLFWNKTTLGSGRAASVSGDYVFEFTR